MIISAQTRPEPVTYVDFPIRVRTARVARAVRLTPTMIRLTVAGPGTEGFQSRIFDEHVKLIFPDPDTGELRLPTPDGDELDWPRPFPTSREYTVREHRPEVGEIDIDFVVHPGGLASDWVSAVQPGDPVHIAGPPGGYRVSDDYGFYLLAGDETALPALARWAAGAPRRTVGRLVITVGATTSQLQLDPPPGVEVQWLVDPSYDVFVETVRATRIPAQASVFVWLAGEAGLIKPLRRWVRDDLGLDQDHSSITGYWKRGQADTHEHLDDDDALDDEDTDAEQG